jgi:hypothetical protein
MFKFFTISFKSDLVRDFQSLFFKTYLLSYSIKANGVSNKHVSNNFKKNYQFFKKTKSPSILKYLVNYSIFMVFIGNLGDRLDSRLSKNLECWGLYHQYSIKVLNNSATNLTSRFVYKLDSKLVEVLSKNYINSSNKVGGFKFNQNSNIYSNTLFNKYPTLKKYLSLSSSISHTQVFYQRWVGDAYQNFFNSTNSNQNQVKTQFSNTNVTKYVDLLSLNSYNMQFLRRSKIFNKGRYSRNRQFYRTGVYWCLYLSIILFTGLYYWFYHFIVNFGFFW